MIFAPPAHLRSALPLNQAPAPTNPRETTSAGTGITLANVRANQLAHLTQLHIVVACVIPTITRCYIARNGNTPSRMSRHRPQTRSPPRPD